MKFEFFDLLALYIGLLVFLSFWLSRKAKSLEDFFLASRNLPAGLVYFSLVASWIGATSVLVSVDEAYHRGISSIWVMGVPAVLTALIFAFVLARPIRRLQIVSLPDLVEMRYGKAVRHMAAVLIVWYMLVLAASQMVAIGSFLKMLLGTSYIEALFLGTAVVLIYSVLGGFLSVVITDAFQFFLLVLGLIGLLFFLLGEVAIPDVVGMTSQMGKDEYFSLFSDLGRNLLIVLSFVCAWTISPIVWQRIQAARDEKQARLGLFASAVTFLAVYGVLVFIGILTVGVYPSGIEEIPILSELILSFTGKILGMVLFLGIVAAIMSTMDTAINTGALSLTRDIYQRLLFPKRTKVPVLVGRISTVVVTLLAFLIATRLQSILQTLGLAAEIMAEGFFVPGVAMLFMSRKAPRAGLFSVVLGGGYAVFAFLNGMGLLHLDWPAWPYSVPYGLLLSLLGFVVGLYLDRKKP
ncbi:MAG: hypothetical protein GQ544_06670 [Candidatus Aminicenantes bacterium]|nr:hypothetical protein [Candidatus Aminicenantes bacterium]